MSSDTTTTRTGRCLCGEVTYEISGDPIATAVCHCEHCQRQSGGAFSVNVVMPASQLTISGTLQTYENTNEDGSEVRSEEHTSELQSLMRISYAVFCLKKKKKKI